MEDWNELKDIWQSAEIKGLPDAKEAVRVIKRYRRKVIFKKAATIFLLLSMGGIVVFIASDSNQVITTKLGEMGFFIGILVLLINNLYSLRRAFNQINSSNKEFIKYLLQAERGRAFFYRKMQPVIFLMLTGSLFLLLFEPLSKKPALMAGIYCGLTVYFVAVWFLIRRRFFKNHTETLRKTIEKLESRSE
ncbi:MAG: hypothetical protein R2681_04350 [Pyrinomonadaceae bacterium]